jgi:hypothetical protein
MPRSETHNTLTLRPPPGVRFTIWGSDCELEFQRGREEEIIAWFFERLESMRGEMGLPLQTVAGAAVMPADSTMQPASPSSTCAAFRLDAGKFKVCTKPPKHDGDHECLGLTWPNP